MKPQKGEGRNPWYRERNKQTKKAFKKKLREHSQTPCSGLARYDKSLLPICT
jgi:hypothetical protein